MEGFNIVSKEKTRGKLYLVDLAGSERLSKSSVIGTQRNETIHINKSLTSLADVINAIGLIILYEIFTHFLATGSKHIPFRNSLLTQVLKSSLNGNSKVLMFVNISPAEMNKNETLTSLRFASRVNNCELSSIKFVKPNTPKTPSKSRTILFNR